MGGACSAHGENKNILQNVVGEREGKIQLVTSRRRCGS
jgi:hypothetical protein